MKPAASIDPDAEVPKLPLPQKKLIRQAPKQALPENPPEDPPAEEEEETAPDDPTEGKSDRFKRIAGRRMKVILSQLRLLGNYSRRAGFEYSPENVQRMIGALREAIDELEARYNPVLDDETDFKFE